jgi:hypothetical protein
MTWLSVTELICVTYDHWYVPCIVDTLSSLYYSFREDVVIGQNEQHEPHQLKRGELRCSGVVINSCSISVILFFFLLR